jgi:hypothetical protein
MLCVNIGFHVCWNWKNVKNQTAILPPGPQGQWTLVNAANQMLLFLLSYPFPSFNFCSHPVPDHGLPDLINPTRSTRKNPTRSDNVMGRAWTSQKITRPDPKIIIKNRNPTRPNSTHTCDGSARAMILDPTTWHDPTRTRHNPTHDQVYLRHRQQRLALKLAGYKYLNSTFHSHVRLSGGWCWFVLR